MNQSGREKEIEKKEMIKGKRERKRIDGMGSGYWKLMGWGVDWSVG